MLTTMMRAKEITVDPGRSESRMDVSMAARLKAAGPNPVAVRATIKNLSTHGARVTSECPWHLHDRLKLTDAVGDYSLEAEVVYCERMDEKLFAVGLKFDAAPVSH